MVNTASIPDNKRSLKDLVKVQFLRIEQLETIIRQLKGEKFGSSSEKLNKDQLGLFVDEEEQIKVLDDSPQEITIPEHSRKKKSRCTFPKDAQVTEIIHDLPEEEKECICCSNQKECIGEERSREIKYKSAKLEIVENVRLKYACTICEEEVAIAKLPKKILPKTVSTPSLLTYIIISKIVDGLPLYRLEKIFKRLQVDISRTIMANWLIKVSNQLQPLVNLLLDYSLETNYIQVDETTFQVLKEEGRKATQKSFIWLIRGGPPGKKVIIYYYDHRRSSEVLKNLLADYEGYLQSDGYSVYHVIDKISQGKINVVGCMAHLRRKFFKIIQSSEHKEKHPVACQMLAWIRELYRIEKEAKQLEGFSFDKRKELRDEKSKPILEKMKALCDQEQLKMLYDSQTGKALRYMSKQWKYIIRYLQNGTIEIDNNLAENAIRPFVVGRKNWLFSDSVNGAIATSNFFTLIETAKANQLDPYDYVKWLLKEIPKVDEDDRSIEFYQTLLPWNYSNPN